MGFPFRDRTDAGQELAAILGGHGGRPDVLVLALPRGGVPVAAIVARSLHAPLDLLIVRKLGFPGQEELAMGAIASSGTRVLNDEVVRASGMPMEIIDEIAEREMRELRRREEAYRGDRPTPDVHGKTVIVIDDGLATGSTMLAAVRALRQRHPAHIIVAVPVAPPETVATFKNEPEIDEIVCPHTPYHFGGVGRWYEDFEQTTDDEVRELLQQAWSQGQTA